MSKFLSPLFLGIVLYLFLTTTVRSAEKVEGLKAFGFNEKPILNPEIIPKEQS